MRLFAKYCQICGVRIEKDKDFVRFGKHFCSEDHASKYVSDLELRRREVSREDEGGCC
jgi:hypothetical protein